MKLFVQFYLGEAGRDCGKAATLAGYDNPLVKGPRLERKLQALIREQSTYTPEMVIQDLSEIAGDRKQPQNRIRALELLAKIHGLLSDKININIDRQTLTRDLDTALDKLSMIAARRQGELREGTVLDVPEPDPGDRERQRLRSLIHTPSVPSLPFINNTTTTETEE